MKVTYLLGAGASANALPVVRDMDSRINIFITHLKQICKLDSEEVRLIDDVYDNIKKHYTIDTYAKKLFLKRRHSETELHRLYNFMGAYFIYEQLTKERSSGICDSLYTNESKRALDGQYPNIYSSVIEPIDYRYDSFLATVLQNDVDGDVYLPNDINIISWNYDFQLEISFMNFNIGYGVDEIQNKLNVYPNPDLRELRHDASKIIKINGTAGFYHDGKKYGELFDFRNHKLDQTAMEILRDILFQKGARYKNSIYFAWNEDDVTRKTREYARNIVANTDILVVIGYSFPYFNREVDRYIFKALEGRSTIKYIQTTHDTFGSVKQRAIGTTGVFSTALPFTEIDQFLIPNEL